ncbi:Multidrug-efflux transporter 1 regulator [Anaerotruncus sp. 2789STDY5834896]|uniref:Multidrug-efflux transporter 1 regulator n=1 Tax=uncultured Anaerotruncus sp. TaxID=905011 RepID=A0A1C6I5W3_9FIRM|nr:Multidrug-efflux transporter 1 regulator [uncultured Anaerotruncus sp.]
MDIPKGEILYTVGEFAALHGISRQTLIYYDRTGLFSPAVVGQNGYRYYTNRQSDILSAIRTLKEIGSSLREIGDYLHGDSGTLLALLQSKQQWLAGEIRRLQALHGAIDRKTAQTQLAASHPVEVPWLEERPQEYFLCMPIQNPLGITSHDYTEASTQLMQYCTKYPSTAGNLPGSGVSCRQLQRGIYQNGSYMAIQSTEQTGDRLERVRTAGLCGVIHHRGSYGSTQESYRILLDFIRRQGLTIVEGSYEYDLLTYLSVKDEQSYVTRVEIRVER